MICDSVEYVEIESIEAIGVDDVYDISMATEFPSFIANEIVVHNSGGMRHILKQLAMGSVLNFEDLCATTSLYRPGPMESGMIEDYILWKQTGEEPHYEHPKMREVLASTGGSIIYQESVMELSKQLAGYSMAEADVLRKIMGKKKPEEMAKQRDKFVQGCINHSEMSEELGGAIFDKIDKFAGYGFNKSHAAAYSLISYWCQYLKTHHPAEYFAAQLTIADDEDKLKSAVMAAKKSGINVLPPDINISTDKFEIGEDYNGRPVLYSALQKLKGLSEKSAAAILEARMAVGRFESKKHFESSINKRACNARVREALDKVGAFTSIEPDQVAWDDESRLKDQIELLPGLIVRYVKPNRKTPLETVEWELQAIKGNIRACCDCDFAGQCVVPSAMGKQIRYMIITDAPTKEELRYRESFHPEARRALVGTEVEHGPMTAAGLPLKSAYFTSVVKSKGSEKLTPEQISVCKRHLNEEIELIKPPLIVCLGGAAIRHFYPEVRGGWSELSGQVHYHKELDATIVFGINPQMMYFREEAYKMLVDVFKTVRQILT